MPYEQAAGIPAQRVVPVREERVESRNIVRHQRGLVGEYGIHESIGLVSAIWQMNSGSPHAKSAFRMRACTPHTRSTTCDTSKSVAAER